MCVIFVYFNDEMFHFFGPWQNRKHTHTTRTYLYERWMIWTERVKITLVIWHCHTRSQNHHSPNQFWIGKILVYFNIQPNRMSDLIVDQVSIYDSCQYDDELNCIARDSQIPFTCALAPIRSRTHTLNRLTIEFMKRQNQLDLFASRDKCWQTN